MFCPNCGKELQEGEVCTCAQNNEAVIENEAAPSEVNEAEQVNVPVQEAPAQEAPQGYYIPNAPQQNAQGAVVFPGAYYDPNQAYANNQPKEDVPARTDYPEGYKIKKKYVAVLLALSVGMFGIHNFYLGNKDKAIAQLVVSLAGGILTLGLGMIAATIWATVEGVLILTENIDKDSNGYKIQTFEESLAAQLKKD